MQIYATKPIHQYAIQPIEHLGSITHLDAKLDVGVDVNGDLAYRAFRAKIAEKMYNLIFRNNVLINVQDSDHVYETMSNSLADDGFVVLSAPNQYLYYSDLFDSMYRPSRADIECKLPTLQTIRFVRLESSETMLTRFIANKRLLLAFRLNIFVPRRGLRVWKNVAGDLVNLNKRFATLGLVMHRQPRPASPLASDARV